MHQVESIHFPKTVPQFQSGISTAIQFPAEEEFTSREEWYDEHMPSLGKNIKGNEPEVKNEEGNFQLLHGFKFLQMSDLYQFL